VSLWIELVSLSSFFAPGGISAFLQTRSGVRSTQAAWCFISSPGDNYYQLGLSASLVLVLGRAECFGISPYFMLSTSSLQARCTWTIDRVILKVSQWTLHLTYINYEIQMVFPSSIGFSNFPLPTFDSQKFCHGRFRRTKYPFTSRVRMLLKDRDGKSWLWEDPLSMHAHGVASGEALIIFNHYH